MSMKRKAERQLFGHDTNTPTNTKTHTSNKKKKLSSSQHVLLVKNKKCSGCGAKNSIIDDSKAGRKVCTECGLVAENQIISDQYEVRIFADNDTNAPTIRVGHAQPYLLQETGDLSTSIHYKDNAKFSKTQKQFCGNSAQSKLSKNIKTISNYCSRLNLPKDVQNIAGELFKELTTKKEMKGKKSIVVIATCVYIAAKQCHCDRPLKELCEEFMVDRANVRKIHTEIHKLKSADQLCLPVIKKGKGMIKKSTAEIFAEQFANKLKLNVNTIKNLRKITRKIMEKGLLSGKQPTTIAAVAIYLTCIVSEDELQRRSYKEISGVARVSEHKISNTFKTHLFLVRKQLIPEGYGDPLRINQTFL